MHSMEFVVIHHARYSLDTPADQVLARRAMVDADLLSLPVMESHDPTRAEYQITQRVFEVGSGPLEIEHDPSPEAENTIQT